jgi:hypothetical protein
VPLPDFNSEGDLSPGVYRATLAEVLQRFGQGSVQRSAVADRQNRLCSLAISTGQLARFAVFGSVVTAKPDPDAHFGASVFSGTRRYAPRAIRALVDKAITALDGGIHLLLVDVHPPGLRDPHGIDVVLNEIGTENYVLGSDRPLTAVASIGGTVVEAFVANVAVGEPIPPCRCSSPV